jgi:hypothetical protein
MNEILIAIFIVAVLLIILVFIFVSTTKRANVLIKNLFVDKLQEYDYLIDDKEKKIEELNQTIEKKKKSYVKLEQELEDLEKSNISREKVSIDSDINLPTNADFEDGNILTGYKKIKEGFDFNPEKILKDFINKNVKEDKNYTMYKKIRSYFNYDTMYKIMTYQPNEQKIIMKELLSDKEYKIVENLLNIKKFNIVKFVDKLDDLILKANPEILVYTGEKNKKYNYLHNQIKTIYDDKITEGFKIIYKGVVYDYSI